MPEEMYGLSLLRGLILRNSDTLAFKIGNARNMLVCSAITKDVGSVSIA